MFVLVVQCAVCLLVNVHTVSYELVGLFDMQDMCCKDVVDLREAAIHICCKVAAFCKCVMTTILLMFSQLLWPMCVIAWNQCGWLCFHMLMNVD